MQESFIEGLEKTQRELNGKTSKGAAVMILGGLVTIVGLNTMLSGLETTVEASTISKMLSAIRETVEEVEVG